MYDNFPVLLKNALSQSSRSLVFFLSFPFILAFARPRSKEKGSFDKFATSFICYGGIQIDRLAVRDEGACVTSKHVDSLGCVCVCYFLRRHCRAC